MHRVWLLVLAIVLTIALSIYAAVFDTSEFRGLGFTMIHLVFVTPALLALPPVLHINAPPQIRKTLRLLNWMVVLGLGVSWIVLLSR